MPSQRRYLVRLATGGAVALAFAWAVTVGLYAIGVRGASLTLVAALLGWAGGAVAVARAIALALREDG